MNGNLGSLLDQLAAQYKKGYRTSEFWVVMLVGLVQVMSASFNPNKTLSSQLSNLTWVGIAYIVSRSGLKVARLASATRIVSTVTSATLTPPQPAPDAEAATPMGAQAAANATTSYCWPVAPFDQMHPVRAYLNDPRQGATSSAFHYGIDVSAPDGTPVYAVESGTVYMEGAQNVAVSAPDRSHEFGYWHLLPAVVEHQTVHKHDLLGHIAPGWAHVHFAERRGGEYLNPLRSGALTPFADHRPPEIEPIYCARGGTEIDPMRLHGA